MGFIGDCTWQTQNRPRILVKVRSEELSLERIALKKNLPGATHVFSDHQYAEKFKRISWKLYHRKNLLRCKVGTNEGSEMARTRSLPRTAFS